MTDTEKCYHELNRKSLITKEVLKHLCCGFIISFLGMIYKHAYYNVFHYSVHKLYLEKNSERCTGTKIRMYTLLHAGVVILTMYALKQASVSILLKEK